MLVALGSGKKSQIETNSILGTRTSTGLYVLLPSSSSSQRLSVLLKLNGPLIIPVPNNAHSKSADRNSDEPLDSSIWSCINFSILRAACCAGLISKACGIGLDPSSIFNRCSGLTTLNLPEP